MAEYQVIARKFRPQSFKEVVGQEAIVTTLKNAIKFNRLAQAYLFCGSRGTGKTTLARILSKALNCQQLSPEQEPCQVCSSCLEITSGSSMDVIEIDGASNRGIEDIRQINETVGYAAAGGGYKIYIIDEVHMLTKEAFNALLKTLEEPPPRVKFFFATTEPQKVLPTIMSRCQRFNLNRIPTSEIANKLHRIAQQLNVEVEVEALLLVAQRSEGGMRDAESLFDQLIAFTDGKLKLEQVNAILGLMSRDTFFEIDQAGKEGHLAKAFEISHQVYSGGKDISHFIDGLIDHFRSLLLIKMNGMDAPYLTLSMEERERYAQSARFYRKDQLLELIEYLIESQPRIRSASFGKTALEAILLHVMRSHYRLSIGQLVARLSELEQSLGHGSVVPSEEIQEPILVVEEPKEPSLKISERILSEDRKPVVTKVVEQADPHVSEDPTPMPEEVEKPKDAVVYKKEEEVSLPPVKKKEREEVPQAIEVPLKRAVHEYDTLFQFAAVELEGKLLKNNG